jgi:hypothetical protein
MRESGVRGVLGEIAVLGVVDDEIGVLSSLVEDEIGVRGESMKRLGMMESEIKSFWKNKQQNLKRD